MILLEHGPKGQAALFDGALAVHQAWTADEVAGALAALDAARAAGRWVAGWIAYEAGYALEPKLAGLMPAAAGPLVCFGVFEGPQAPGAVLAQAKTSRL